MEKFYVLTAGYAASAGQELTLCSMHESDVESLIKYFFLLLILARNRKIMHICNCYVSLSVCLYLQLITIAKLFK